MKLDIRQVLFQIVNFGILLVLLKKYLYAPVLKILEERAKKIREGLEAAEQSITEREKLEKERRRALVEAQKTANEILESARVRAGKVEKELVEKAQRENQRRSERARELSLTHTKDMEVDLQRRFTETVIATTETVLREALSPKHQREIIKHEIQRLRKTKLTL